MQDKYTQAKALRELASNELRHVEGLLGRSHGRATAAEVQRWKARAAAARGELDRLEAIIGRAVARDLSGRDALAARAIDNWDEFRGTHWLLDVPGKHKLADADDARLLDIPMQDRPATGVWLVWSDDLQSIVSAAFEKLIWKVGEAKRWLDEWLAEPKEETQS